MRLNKKSKKKGKTKSSDEIDEVVIHGGEEMTTDAKEVLDLFNKLEELVVDGDPRIREALNQKPGIQNLLRDDSSMYGLSPRFGLSPRTLGQLGQPPPPEGLQKEVTNTSLLSQRYRQTQQNTEQLQRPRHFIQPQQFPSQASRQPQKNILVPSIRIPERSNLDFSQDEMGMTKKHPDGTLFTKILEDQPPHLHQTKYVPTFNQQFLSTIQPQQPTNLLHNQQPINLLPYQQSINPFQNQQFVPSIPIQSNQQFVPNQPPQPQHNNHSNHSNNKSIDANKRQRKQQPKPDPQFHLFDYETKEGKSSVRIVMDGNTQRDEATVEPDIEPPSTMPQNYGPQLTQTMPQHEPMTNSQPNLDVLQYRQSVNRNKGGDSISKVIGQKGGCLELFGCKIEVPKNALQEKSLVRLTILDNAQIPHRMDRIYSHYNHDDAPVTMAITPAVRIDPVDLVFEKAITVKLPTCIAVHGQSIQLTERGPDTSRARENTDISVDDIIIKERSVRSRGEWKDLDTQVFRSADSVTFKLEQLGDVCACHHNSNTDEGTLNKRLSVFLFKSFDNRKKQFISLLISEDMPHVTQKGIESMPEWLKYCDSVTNIILPERKNFVIYVNSQDRTTCTLDANKIEIPWENLWRPECISKKHIGVTLTRLEVPAQVEINFDETNKLTTDFMWQIRYQEIRLPDIMTSGEPGFKDKWENEGKEVTDADLKKVSWKPPTPQSKFVTNEQLLNYATMHAN